MSDVITVDELWQSYRLRLRRPTLKATISTLAQGRNPHKWALRGVSMSVEQGDFLGLIGANGSGKSTMLRCLAGILRPSKGTVTVTGRVASLIDLGSGFHPDLNAIDNILLAGAIYGIPRSTLKDRFDEIVAFAELEEYVRHPLRAYSSGMALRLGFSLAVSLDPDILLVDEVLAVGDEAFKVKCLERIASVRDRGTTIVFVSHELAMVRALCNRVIVLDQGEKLFEGGSEDAIHRYCDHLGVSYDFAMSRPIVAPEHLERLESAWQRHRKAAR